MAKQQPRRKHVPQRTCVICRNTSDKRQLTRLVRTPAGIEIDPGGKMNGRGAYVCDRETCRTAVLRPGILDRALRSTVSEEDRARLRASLLPATG